jgi:hypothetical protein
MGVQQLFLFSDNDVKNIEQGIGQALAILGFALC